VVDLPAHVPLLADVLAVCEGMVVNIEIKNAPRTRGGTRVRPWRR